MAEEGATGEVVTGASVAARADWISSASSSSLSGSMALYSKAGGSFAPGATAERGAASTGGEAAVAGLPLPPLYSDSLMLRRGDKDNKSKSFVCFAPLGPEPPFFYFFFPSEAVAPPAPPALHTAF